MYMCAVVRVISSQCEIMSIVTSKLQGEGLNRLKTDTTAAKCKFE